MEVSHQSAPTASSLMPSVFRKPAASKIAATRAKRSLSDSGRVIGGSRHEGPDVNLSLGPSLEQIERVIEWFQRRRRPPRGEECGRVQDRQEDRGSEESTPVEIVEARWHR